MLQRRVPSNDSFGAGQQEELEQSCDHGGRGRQEARTRAVHASLLFYLTIELLSDHPDNQAQERVGSVLNDKWTLERVLGVGGMAAVYAARHRNGARAAVKVLHADLSRHADVRERFLREGYAANRVEHPGVVKVLDDEVIASGPDAGTAYLVMELLDGESLQDRLERGPTMGEREFLLIADSVLDVLDAAHTRGVVHRDLKPENLFLTRSSDQGASSGVSVKILDFGLARLLQGQAITSYGLALGTPSFMSPEQAAGRIDEIDGRTDLFALAATGFRLRTGRRIHEGANAVELVMKMANVPAPRIRAVAPEASEPFARVIDRALEFRREDRYPTAAAMRDDVKKGIAELDDDNVRTLFALPAVRPPPPAAETTFEASASDLEPSIPAPGPLPKALPGAKVEAKPKVALPDSPEWPEESIRIPRRHSILPWLFLVALVGLGAKFWPGVRKVVTGAIDRVRPPVSTTAVTGSDSAAPGASDASASSAAPAAASASASPAIGEAHRDAAPVGTVPPPRPSAIPPASSGHHASPPSTSTGSAHIKPASQHPARSTGSKSSHQ